MADELKELEQQIAAKAEEIKAEQAKVEEPAPPIEEPTPEAPASAVEIDVTPGIETTEYGKKKGWKTPEEAAESMRQLEKSFHAKSEELKRLKESQPPVMPSYAPPPNPYAAPQYYPQQPAYAPPPNPYAPQYGQPRMSEEQIAASYGLTVEAFKAMLPLAQDVANATNRQALSEFQRWKQDQERNNAKRDDMTQILADPAFHNPDVRAEMHEIFSKTPELFNEPHPYSQAMTQALANIGRKQTTRGNYGPSSLPSEPPKVGQQGTGFSGRKKIGAMPTEAEMQNMSPAELEKQLKALNAVKTYADL